MPDSTPRTVAGDPDAFGSPYRLLSSVVIPRPIAWTATRAPDGTANLAPFSFFTVVSLDPPILSISTTGTGDDCKDTAVNAEATGELVVHVVTEAVVAAMNETSATLPADESEFDHAGIETVACDRVAVPRVAAARIAFECDLLYVSEIGSSAGLYPEVVRAHVDQSLLTDGKLDVNEGDAVGRLAGSRYARTTDRFALERPP
jgi:flavin reductase (DIM6/NTAB) family NADH-FMN oxidoreductase RutF